MGLSQAKRLLTAHGVDVTLTTYTEGATDAYEDPADSASTSTVRAIRDAGRPNEGRTVRDASGQETLVDETFFVASDAGVDADPSNGRAPEVTDSGETFQVLVTRPEDGFQRLECRRMRQ